MSASLENNKKIIAVLGRIEIRYPALKSITRMQVRGNSSSRPCIFVAIYNRAQRNLHIVAILKDQES